MPPTIVFDLDGTLVDSRQDLTTGVNLMRAHYGLPVLSVDTVTSFIGDGLRKLVERALDGTGVDIADAIGHTRDNYLAHMLDETRLYRGVAETLGRLAELGCPMAVVTNKPEAPASAILEGLGVARFFACVAGGDTCPRLKPDPQPIYYAIDQIGGDTHNAWMVGDNHTDIKAGRRAGIKTCYCGYGFGDPRDEKYDLAVESLADFADHVGDA